MSVRELFAYLRVRNAGEAITFYAVAFGARETMRLNDPSGRIGHAELEFGETTLMLSDEFPEYGVKAPDSPESASTLHIHVDDADAVIAQALRAGATLEREAQDQFYGERSGTVIDPFGHRWIVGHSIEEVSPAEMQRRYDEFAS